MKKSITSWLVFTAFFLIHLQFISSEIICFSIESLYPLCEKDSTELIHYVPEYGDYTHDISTAQIIDSDIKMIEEYTFDDVDSVTKTKKLILSLSDGNLIIEKYAFTKLTRLESLEITRGRVQLNYHIFQELDFLKSLKLRVNENIVKLNQALIDIPNLESLEILDNQTIGICDSFNGELILSKLQYTGGEINKISNNSFKCLTQLKTLKIMKTHLSVIEAGGIDTLKGLKILSITYNQFLSYIPPSDKVNIFKLITLDLSKNSIKAIESDALIKKVDSNCLLLNLSYNLIDHLTNKSFENCQCKTIDLSANQIIFIANGVFDNAIAEKILMNENLIRNFEDHAKWGIHELNRIHFDIIHHEIAVNRDSESECINQKCYSSDNNIFEICKSCKTLLSVKMKSMPTRLSPKILEISDDQLLYIEKRAFSNLFIETLIIVSSSEMLELNHETFVGLSTLRSLRFETSSIPIGEVNANTLKKLEHLVLTSPQLIERKLCMYVKLLVSLLSIIVTLHTSANFCNNLCTYKNTKLQYFEYKKGLFKVIPSNSFECLPGLNYLIIIDGILSTIDTGAFNGLENLNTLILDKNRITAIKENTFIGLKKLKKLSLSRNWISIIHNSAFRLQESNHFRFVCTNQPKNRKSCKPETLSVLDLSFNKLQNITVDMFDNIWINHINLAHNNLKSIDDSEFEHYEVLDAYNNVQLYLHKNYENNMEFWCYDENSFVICMKNHELLSVTHNDIDVRRKFDIFGPKNPLEIESNLVLELHIDNIYISSIYPFAFVDMTNRNQIKTLIIYKHVKDEFILSSQIFAGLTALENLELNVGPINLADGYFDNLYNLKSLKVEAIDDDFYLSATLQYLSFLKSLDIVGNASVGVCNDPFSESLPPITTLSYTSGSITILQKKSLTCLTYLENFKISDTLLRTIEADAFYGLSHLKTINLAHNELKHIPIDVFNHIQTLNVLELNNNQIDNIDARALTVQNNFPYYHMSLVNISDNELRNLKPEQLKGLKCRVLDLSNNKIELDSFTIPHSCVTKVSLDRTKQIFDNVNFC